MSQEHSKFVTVGTTTGDAKTEAEPVIESAGIVPEVSTEGGDPVETASTETTPDPVETASTETSPDPVEKTVSSEPEEKAEEQTPAVSDPTELQDARALVAEWEASDDCANGRPTPTAVTDARTLLEDYGA